ncbi:MAG: magnesium-translocating P-type ATPase [Phyllobacteriaceae bacterium]|nr:magnesium-translocating P-type ATPase [Phyllobacteriaceae bacterium]
MTSIAQPRIDDPAARSSSPADALTDLAARPLADLLSDLDGHVEGLGSAEARRRRARHGANRIDDTEHRRHLLRAAADRFRNPLVLVLLVAAGVSAFTGDVPSFVVVTVIVLMSVVLDVVQEHRAENAAEALRARVSLTAEVRRDGVFVSVPATEIVPGDVVRLTAGNLVPADARLVEGRDLYVDEALLTGEPYPIEKEPEPAPAGAEPTAFPRNLVFMGASVVSGGATAVVFATGRDARIGAIAETLRKPPPPTAFALGIRDFGLMIVRLTVALVLFVLLINLVVHRPAIESFLFALALAVGLTPELLPMVVSVTLAHGALRLSRREVIVKRLSAIHDLGAMDVLCSDKTGTLTDAKIALVREVDIDGAESSGVLRWAEINATWETGLKSPLDEAILARGTIDPTEWKKIDEVPFDFERRRVSVLVEHAGRRLLVVKGAPEDVLALADRHETASGEVEPLDDDARRRALATFQALGGDGFRVLAVAWREVEADRVHAGVADESRLAFAGFLAFLDPPKAGAREALAELSRLGVAVKVVTGDNEGVTRHVVADLGLAGGALLTGPQIAGLSDDALAARLEATTLFCRITPAQKSRIIAALRHKGHVVGYIGDGINDAPSLHAADVGFSVDTAVDVAKQAAAMILLRKDLGVLSEGVREGRRTSANILKYMMMATSSNFGNMFSMAGGVLFLPFLPMLPIQILLNNLLYDLSETAIPLDRVPDAMVARPRRWDLAAVRDFMYVLGPISSLFDFATFAVLALAFRVGETGFHTGWFVESMATQILVIFVIRAAHPWRDRPHPLLVASTLGAFGCAVALPWTPLAPWLGFSPLPPLVLAILAGLVVVYLVVVDLAKRRLFERHGLA